MSFLLVTGTFTVSVAVFVATIYFWNAYTERARFDSIRHYLLLVLLLIMISEACALGAGLVRPYFLPVTLFIDLYGFFDAIIRFPSVPRLESFFCLKLFLAVIGKTVVYSIGFVDIHKWALLFLSTLFLNVWLLPILYVLTVPYGDSSPFRTDRDLLIRLALLVVDSKEREDTFHALKLSFTSLKHSLGIPGRTISVSPKRSLVGSMKLISTSPTRMEISAMDKAFI